MGAQENQTEVTDAVWLETGWEIAPGSPQPWWAKTCLHSPGSKHCRDGMDTLRLWVLRSSGVKGCVRKEKETLLTRSTK